MCDSLVAMEMLDVRDGIVFLTIIVGLRLLHPFKHKYVAGDYYIGQCRPWELAWVWIQFL